MEITRKAWMKYIQNLAKADDKAAELIVDYLSEHEILSDKGFYDFVDYFYAVVTKYAEGASEMACQMYEALAEVQGAIVQSAIPAETPTYGECMKAVRGTMLDSDQTKSLAQTAGRLVRQTGVDTTVNNALRDGAEWAWVPNGDTCAFCMMLASNGWQRASKKAIKNGHAKHIHANCDCTYAIRFDGKSTVEGYDPDYYKALYDNAEGDNWKEKLNSMRRERYAVNKDKINAQKRIAYKARKGPSNDELLSKAVPLYLKYGSADSVYIFGNPEEMKIVSDIQKAGLNFDGVKAKIMEDTDNWQRIINDRVQDRDKLNKEFTKQLESLTEAEADALSTWTTSLYTEISQFFRGGYYVRDEVKQIAENIVKALDKCETSEDLILRRSVPTPTLNNIFNIDGWKDDVTKLIGQEYTEKQCMAATPFGNGGSGGQHKVFLHAPKGTKGAYIESVSHANDELEFLLQAGTKGRIVNAKAVPNPAIPEETIYEIYVEVING